MNGLAYAMTHNITNNIIIIADIRSSRKKKINQALTGGKEDDYDRGQYNDEPHTTTMKIWKN